MCLPRIPFFEPYTPPVVGSENFPPFALLLGRANIEIEEECEARQRLQMETKPITALLVKPQALTS